MCSLYYYVSKFTPLAQTFCAFTKVVFSIAHKFRFEIADLQIDREKTAQPTVKEKQVNRVFLTCNLHVALTTPLKQAATSGAVTHSQ